MAMQGLQRKTAARPGEREIIDCLIEHVNAYQREVVVNCEYLAPRFPCANAWGK